MTDKKADHRKGASPDALIAQTGKTTLRLPVVTVVLLNLLAYLLGGLALKNSWDNLYDRGLINSQNLSALLVENIRGQISLIDQSLLDVSDEFSRQMATGRVDSHSMTSFLAVHRQRLPILESLRVTDKDGITIYGPDIETGSKFTASDRDYFLASRDDPAAGLIISKPLLGRITNQWLVVFARRLTNANGSFAGIVYAPLPISRLTQLFSTLDLGKNGMVSLRGEGFVNLARYPEDVEGKSTIGVTNMSPDIIERWKSNPVGGSYEAPAGIDKVQRIFTYRRVGNYPLTLWVGLSVADCLAGWWSDAIKIGLAMVLFTAISAIAALLLTNASRAQVAANRKLESAKQDLERFTEVLAHHLQEPVRLQYAFAQRLEKLLPKPLAGDAQEAIDYVLEGAMRLKALLRDAQLYLSVQETDETPAPCSAEQCLSTAMDKLDTLIVQSAADIRFDPLPYPCIPAPRLTELFVVLLRNAIENRRPDVALEIRVTTRFEGAMAVIVVTDNGYGIPAEFHDRVFSVFERLASRAKSSGAMGGGTGIGLAIARKIVEAAKGAIWVENVKTGGASLCFSLPVSKE